MKTRYSYAETNATESSLDRLAREVTAAVADEIGSRHLADAIGNPASAVSFDCCEVEKKARAVLEVLAHDVCLWRGLLDFRAKATNPEDQAKVEQSSRKIRACAKWKVQRLCMAIYSLEEALLERTHLNDDEDPGEGFSVVEIETR